MKKYILYILVAAAILQSCNLTKTVDINLPPYERLLLVESYLEPNQPYRLLLGETIGYFDPLGDNLPLISNATVVITYDGQKDTLQPGFFFDLNGNLFNYGSNTLVVEDYEKPYTLEITDSVGRTISATTTLPKPVVVDSNEIIQSGDSTYFFLTYVKDNPDEDNYYRKLIHKSFPADDSLVIAFTFDDQFINTDDNQISSGMPPFFEAGDTAVVTVYGLTEEYFNYLETIEDAELNNGNPFGQPGTVITNIEGGQGIFTGIYKIRESLIIE